MPKRECLWCSFLGGSLVVGLSCVVAVVGGMGDGDEEGVVCGGGAGPGSFMAGSWDIRWVETRARFSPEEKAEKEDGMLSFAIPIQYQSIVQISRQKS